MITVLNILGMVIYDYSYRISEKCLDEIRQEISFFIQLFCTVSFSFVFLIRIMAFGFLFGPDACMKNFWNVLNLLDLFGGFILKQIVIISINSFIYKDMGFI